METLLKKIEDLKAKLLEIRGVLDIDQKELRVKELRLRMSDPDIWSDRAGAVKIGREAEELDKAVKVWQHIGREIKDLEEISTLAQQDGGGELTFELESKYQDLLKKFANLELVALFSEKYDQQAAILSIHAGTGGVDAQDWAQMLERMYLRFSERQGWKAEILDHNYGNEAGLKSATLLISGPWAYGYLKSENGVHRLLRNSPFNADGLRQTSFALVEVMPEIAEESELELKDEDLRIDVYRSSGPGGQSVNTTDSAVRVVHLPTGLTVACQSERSQHQNKENALKILRTKLYQRSLEEREAEQKELKGETQKAEWGRQIRSYFLYGNRLVKDHRSELESTDVDKVLDGELENFMEAYLRWLKR